ncbi:hypothetical protein ABKN59_011793 [Abortiporus biennis]
MQFKQRSTGHPLWSIKNYDHDLADAMNIPISRVLGCSWSHQIIVNFFILNQKKKMIKPVENSRYKIMAVSLALDQEPKSLLANSFKSLHEILYLTLKESPKRMAIILRVHPENIKFDSQRASNDPIHFPVVGPMVYERLSANVTTTTSTRRFYISRFFRVIGVNYCWVTSSQ